MTPKDLIQKVCGTECEFAPAEAVDTARAAFLANLAGLLKINLPVERCGDKSMRGKTMFYADLVAGFSGEISEDVLRDAHLAMIFPGNRAIISRLLRGPGNVTHQGIPADYGV